jgi:serine/threonine-protein kinase
MERSWEERWPDIERLLDQALDSAPTERVALIARTRSVDPVLAADLERLLDADLAASRFLTHPASVYAASLLAWTVESDPLEAGAILGCYEIVRRLGRGATATVYLARDARHHRVVALKVLRPELAAALGPARFLREIEIAASLHHPHILPLFDSGAIDGLLFYVMPHVEGESLRNRLVQGNRMPLDEALRIAREVAGALDYSHRHGVVHRDIKPENILLQDGQAIVADFGIARAIDAAGEGVSESMRGTGTPSYMSPEQAAPAAAIDGRTDIYALGCVLYEMMSGKPPFTGSAQEILAGHARSPVPTLSGAGVPVAIESAVIRALAKDPADRFTTAAELGHALSLAGADSGGEVPAARRVATWRWKLGGVLVLAGLAGLVAHGVRSPAPIRLGHRAPVTLDPGLEIDPAISPDGRFVAYAAGPASQVAVSVRPIGRRTPVTLAPGAPRPQRFPSWSPDGRRILFRSPRGIEMVSATGGDTRVMIPEPARPPSDTGRLQGSTTVLMPGTWAPDGHRFAFVRNDSLYIADAGGQPIRLVARGGEPHSASWSPDGRWIAYVTGNRQSMETGFYFGNAGKSTIWIVRSDGGESKLVLAPGSSDTHPTWLPDSRGLLFISDRDGGRDIYQATGSLESGGPRRLASLRLTTGLNPSAISLSADGRRLVYSVFSETSNVWKMPIPSDSPVSISEARPVTTGSQVIEGFDVSPDGRWLAFDSDRSGNPDIYRVPVEGGEAEQLTTEPTSDFGPLWSPDGRQLAFHSFREGVRQIFVMSDRGREQVQVTRGPDDSRGPIWLAGGREILYRSLVRGEEEVRVIAKGDDGRWAKPRTILRGDILQVAASPDGTRLAFASPSGLNVSSTAGDSVRVVVRRGALGGGLRPNYVSWSTDSREIYFLALDPVDRATVWSVPRDGGIPRLLVRFDDPTKDWHRYGFRASSGRFYFTIGDRQSDIWQMDVMPGRRLGQ